jgi:hypothetical protein
MYPRMRCRYLAQVENTKLTNAPEVFVDRDGRFFPVVYSVAPLHGGYQHGAVIVSAYESGSSFGYCSDEDDFSTGIPGRLGRGAVGGG